MTELAGQILTPQGWLAGRLWHHGGRIVRTEGSPVTEAEALSAGAPILLPGFVDLHVHGGAGRDVMEGGDAAVAIAQAHARHGTTSLLATTMTAPLDELQTTLRSLRPACTQRAAGAARIHGIHLEGPYLSAAKLGAQPDFTRTATLHEIMALHALAPIRLLTLAPEVPGHLALISALRAAGLTVQIGHSEASYEIGVAALAAGAAGFTHLFNAMSPLHQRAPGLVGAALAHATHAEIIPDLLHVHAGALRVALRAIPKLYCVTDSTAGAGMPDGPYRLGRQVVHKCLGGMRLADGTLAGSALTMDQALRNLVSLGLSVQEASARTASHAAGYMRWADRGHLAVGASADVVLLDRNLQVTGVLVEGEALNA